MTATVPEPSAAVATLFGDRLDLARRYAELLVRERHLANCAVVTELVPQGARVVDVGSGAGLPGLVLAIRRPDLHVDLVDSLQRRTDFLSEAVARLGLEAQVRVVRGRAEDPLVVDSVGEAEWVTARAVAPLDRLVGWCLPLLRAGGRLLAIKGSSAQAEVSEHSSTVRRRGGVDLAVVRCGVGALEEPTAVIVVARAAERAKKGRT
jgi:16S rRNA (guanine527-N7)-methyltransferase